MIYCKPFFGLYKRIERKKKMKGFRNYTKICPLCGTEFKAHSKKRMYCSNSCKTQACIKRKEEFDPIAREAYNKYLQQVNAQNELNKHDDLFEALNQMTDNVIKPNSEGGKLASSLIASAMRVKLAGTYEKKQQIKPMSYEQYKSTLKRKLKEYGKK